MPTNFSQIFAFDTAVLHTNGEVSKNTYVELTASAPASKVDVVDVIVTADNLEKLTQAMGKKAVLLTASDSPESLDLPLNKLDMIAIDFADFNDGRGYSFAALLRRQGFSGELRAVGDVFQDTLFYLKRCGFNSFVLKAEQCMQTAKQGLTTFSQPYQASVIEANGGYQTGAS